MSCPEKDPVDEIEIWRKKALNFSKSDKLGNLLMNSYELVQSVVTTGPTAKGFPLKIEALSMECEIAMAEDTIEREQRSLHYGMQLSLCTLLNWMVERCKDGNKKEKVASPMSRTPLEQHEVVVIDDRSLEASVTSNSVFNMEIDDESLEISDHDTSEESDVVAKQTIPASDNTDNVIPELDKTVLRSNIDMDEDENSRNNGLIGQASTMDRPSQQNTAIREVVTINPGEVKNGFVCSHCKKQFKFKYLLIIHVRNHSGDRPFKCHVCVKSFTIEYRLSRHLQNVHGTFEKHRDKPHYSHYSHRRNKKVNTVEDAQIVEDEPIGKNNAVERIDYFDALDKTFSEFLNRSNYTDGEVDSSTECMNIDNLDYQNGNNDALVAGESLDTNDEADSGQQKGDEIGIIDIKIGNNGAYGAFRAQCKKMFKSAGDIRKHSSSVKCERCDKTFKEKQKLIRHLREIHCLNPFNCQICEETFKMRSELTIHKNNVHGMKMHRCETCGKFFRDSHHLHEHTRRHTGERPFRCEACGKCYAAKGNLKEHLQGVHGIAPDKCSAMMSLLVT